MPVRGDASLTWADIDVDLDAPPPDDLAAARNYPGLSLQCGRTGEGRCDDAHHAGNTGSEPGNTRGVTMPGEPFGLAVSDDATSLVITHQSDTKASLFSTGLAAPSDDPNAQSPSGVTTPSIQFVLDGLPAGGVGIAPLRPAIYSVLAQREKFGNVLILYGDVPFVPPEAMKRPEAPTLRAASEAKVRPPLPVAAP